MMNNVLDVQDYKKLLKMIIHQAVDDYIKLQHPRNRKKKFLLKAYYDAIDMFFDSTYLFEHLLDEEGIPMSPKDLFNTALDTNNFNAKTNQKNIIKQSLAYWKEKHMDTIHIPDIFVINGKNYHVQDVKDCSLLTMSTTPVPYVIDYDESTVFIDKDNTNANEEKFILAVTEIICYEKDIIISKVKREQFASALYDTLKINNCFQKNTK